MHARRTGKKLVILYPFDLPWKFRFPVTNREIFNVYSPHRAELPAAILTLGRLVITAIYGPFRVLSLVLGKLFGQKAHLPGRFSHPSLGTSTLWRLEEEPAAFDWDIVDRYRWTDELQKPIVVGLTTEKQTRAHTTRLEMGIPEGAWFVSLHVRERGFYNDKEELTCRNATIANYFDAIKEITARGGWVVRLGDKSMTRLPPMERVIDYPHSRFKSDLMDIYLIKTCRFYIGMSSGILDTAFLFQRPMLIMNMTNMTFVYPRRPEDRGIPKHVYSKTKRRFLSVREIFEAPWEAQHLLTLGEDYEMFENSPEELRAATVEFLEDLESSAGLSSLQVEANRQRIRHGRSILDRPIVNNHYDDMHHRYRIASRLESPQGALSNSFLKNNWIVSAKNAAVSVEKNA